MHILKENKLNSENVWCSLACHIVIELCACVYSLSRIYRKWTFHTETNSVKVWQLGIFSDIFEYVLNLIAFCVRKSMTYNIKFK